MKYSGKFRSKRNKHQLTKKYENPLNIADNAGEPIDLSNSLDDDGWDDCFDIEIKPNSALGRLQRMSEARAANAITATKKVKKVKRKKTIAKRQRPKPRVKTVKLIPGIAAIGPNSTPEPNDKALRSLWRCNSVDEVNALHADWHLRFNAKCMKAIEKRRLSDGTRAKIAALLDGSAFNIPILTNNKVLALASGGSHRAIVANTKDDPDTEFALVTVIYGEGGTSLNRPFIGLDKAGGLVLRVVRSMSKNFIGVTELAMFNSHGHPDGGRHNQGHDHVLIWGHDVVAKAQTVATKRMKEFSPNITGAPQIDVRRVPATEVNLARICAYLFKSPHKCMNWNPPKDGKPGHMNQSEKGDRMIRYLRMAQIRSMMTLEDVMFAGGEGIAIRSDLIKLLRQTCHSDVPVQNRLLHPDEIPAFWGEVNKALKRPEWELPVIARRP